ncbi:MAG: hypothetical protein V2I50_07570 [Desulfuromusa sp.]|jgi:hypothetical protein|nr:hypothetical protein [Desulfuromusa sp.]
MEYLTEKPQLLFAKKVQMQFQTSGCYWWWKYGNGLSTVSHQENMPGSSEEIYNTIEERVEFCFNISRCEIRCEADGLIFVHKLKARWYIIGLFVTAGVTSQR